MLFKDLIALFSIYATITTVQAEDDVTTVIATEAIDTSATDTASDSTATGDSDSPSIIGTWSSKSNTVFTGPDFYDPVDELLIEPALPGISYSFTEDGYWEEAIYQVTPNPKVHTCPTAVLIFQHGTYVEGDNGKLTLTPFEIDGRQLLSDPCNDKGESVYSRYVQTEVFKTYQVSVDGYHGRWKLQLYESDGTPMQPLYLAYRPPEMLPTLTMNPVASTESGLGSTSGASDSAVTASASSSAGLSEKVKRSLENRYKTNAYKKTADFTAWYCLSAGLMFVGALLVWKG